MAGGSSGCRNRPERKGFISQSSREREGIISQCPVLYGINRNINRLDLYHLMLIISLLVFYFAFPLLPDAQGVTIVQPRAASLMLL